MSIERKFLRMRDGTPRPTPSYYFIDYVDGRKKRTYLRKEEAAMLLPLLEMRSLGAGVGVGRPPIFSQMDRDMLGSAGLNIYRGGVIRRQRARRD